MARSLTTKRGRRPKPTLSTATASRMCKVSPCWHAPRCPYALASRSASSHAQSTCAAHLASLSRDDHGLWTWSWRCGVVGSWDPQKFRTQTKRATSVCVVRGSLNWSCFNHRKRETARKRCGAPVRPGATWFTHRSTRGDYIIFRLTCSLSMSITTHIRVSE